MELDYGKYYTYNELSEALITLSKKDKSMMRLSSLAKTEEGRDIFLVEITRNINSPESETKAAYYIQASLHSSEPAGGTVALNLIETLLKTNPDILENIIFYIIPRVNPDGVEKNLVYNGCTRSKNAPDPRRKENIIKLKDMDGDGLILQMRVKNSLGDYKEDAPGVMVKRKPGETEGEFYDLYLEGEVINYNGSALGYSHRVYDFNRSYPANWRPTFNSTEYPLRSIENKAIAEFLVTHPNIFAGLDFHNGQNGVLRPPVGEDSTIIKEDLEEIIKVGEIASEIIGFPLIHEYKYGKNPLVVPAGSGDFAYDVLGISHYVIELGNGYNDSGMDTLTYFKYSNRDFQNKKIKEYSDKEGYETFYEFKSFKHPQLGDVEIGGSREGRAYYQNPKVIADITPKATEFMLKHAGMGPELTIGNQEVINVGGNIFRIRAQIKNTGFFGTKVMKGSKSYQASHPVHITLEGENFKIHSRPNVYEIPSLASMESTFVEWFVEAEDKTELSITASHPKSGVRKLKIRTERNI